MRFVKIYGTIGPACRDSEILKQMFSEGMDGIRLNLSHTSLDAASAMIESCHKAACECGVSPELLIDMQGPELRVGRMVNPITLEDGTLISTADILLPEVVRHYLKESDPGQQVLLDDGKILLRSESSSRGTVLRVIRGGLLESRKSVALPGCIFHAPAMTENDREQIKRAKEYGVTAVMQPFVRSQEDLIEVRNALDDAGCEDIRLLAKIENNDGINKLEELIPHCDEIVIARGDLGNAMNLWELPAAQKHISAVCREAGRDFMVVTQMLDSMTHRQVPTRAEVNDIFNAVVDGAASVMVTGETASGDYPVQVIRYLCKTVREAEVYRDNSLR
jgi:pyruvate kinase